MLRIFCALALVFLPWGALAQNDPFDPKRFSPRDLRMIQGGLVEWNEYNGLLDGKWGPASQGALERHIGFFFRTAPTDYLAALVAKGFNGGGEKWVTGFIPEVPLYSAAPVGLLRRTDLDGPHTTLATPNRDLLVRLMFGLEDHPEAMHQWAAERHVGPNPVYTLATDTRRITSVEMESGRRVYLWSIRTNERWSTMLIQSEPAQYARAAIIASSLSATDQEPLTPTPGGWLDRLLQTRGETVTPAPAPVPPVSAAPPTIARPAAPGAGVGIARPVTPAQPAAPGPASIARAPDGARPGFAPQPPAPGAAPGTPRLVMPPLGVVPRGQSLFAAQRAVARGPSRWSTAVAVGPTRWLAPAAAVAGCDTITLIDGMALTAIANDGAVALLEGTMDNPVWLSLATPGLGMATQMAGYPDLPRVSGAPQLSAMADTPDQYAGAALIAEDGALVGLVTGEGISESAALTALAGASPPSPAAQDGLAGALHPLVCHGPPT